MSSKVEICNLALARLGSGASTKIVSMSDNTLAANTCNMLFDAIADRVMMQGAWTSTIRRVELALLVAVPVFGYSYAFQLPVDPFCLKVLSIDECAPNSVDWVIEGDRLLANDNTMKIRYIGRLTDAEDFDPMLAEAVETLLASHLALILTGSKDVAEALKKEYMGMVDHNLGLNNQQGATPMIASNDLITVRL